MRVADLPVHYNAVDILDRNLESRSQKTALLSSERYLTFQEVAEESCQVANALRTIGVSKGQAVGILAPDCAEWVTAFFGTLRSGAVALCLNTLLDPSDYSYIFSDCDMRALIVDVSLLSTVEFCLSEFFPENSVIVIGGEGSNSFAGWIAGKSSVFRSVATHREDFASLHYSSGTTGEPKGVFHAHKDYCLIGQNTGVELFGLRETDRTFSVAKLFFVYGLGGNLVLPWYVGASVVLFRGSPKIAQGVLQVIDDHRPTCFFSVPSAYITMLSTPDMSARFDLSSLRMCVSAGETLPVGVWEQWRAATGLELLDTIGCTESLHTFIANRSDDLRPGSSGKPSPGYECKVVDDSGADLPAGENGNLMVKGETVALSYLHQYEKSRQTFRGEWLFTGDKYRVDEDGFYWHAGRVDDLLKVGGLWVSPLDVEATLRQHDNVRDCAVVGRPDPQGMVKPAAFVTVVEEADPGDRLAAELMHFCSRSLAAHKCPKWVEFVPELPRTATGKVQRFKLREALEI